MMKEQKLLLPLPQQKDMNLLDGKGVIQQRLH